MKKRYLPLYMLTWPVTYIPFVRGHHQTLATEAAFGFVTLAGAVVLASFFASLVGALPSRFIIPLGIGYISGCLLPPLLQALIKKEER